MFVTSFSMLGIFVALLFVNLFLVSFRVLGFDYFGDVLCKLTKVPPYFSSTNL